MVLSKSKSGGRDDRREGRETPDGIWLKCPGCGEIPYRKEIERNRWVCVKCSHHFRIAAGDYIELLVDPDTFEELFQTVTVDALGFKDSKRYADLDQEVRRIGWERSRPYGKRQSNEGRRSAWPSWTSASWAGAWARWWARG